MMIYEILIFTALFKWYDARRSKSMGFGNMDPASLYDNEISGASGAPPSTRNDRLPTFHGSRSAMPSMQIPYATLPAFMPSTPRIALFFCGMDDRIP